MDLRTFDTCLRPFVDRPYAILDEDFVATGDVFICSVGGLVPNLGDRFTIESAGGLHEVGVYVLTISRDGWRVTCRADES